MGKKNEPKKLCWNCDGNISLQLIHCPYCKADLSQPQKNEWDKNIKASEGKENFAFKRKDPLDVEKKGVKIPKPPYSSLSSQESSVTDEEWQKSLEKVEKEETINGAKKEMIALLLLLPGVVFFLFGVLLVLFSQNGVLTMKWNDSFAYFYLIGAIPLLFMGWKYLK